MADDLPPGTMRVLTWNIRDLLGDPLAVARVIRASDADVVCLQEAPRRPGSRWRLAALARGCGLVYVDGGRSSGGTALLTSLRVLVSRAAAVRLPVRGRLTRTRGAVIAELGVPGAPWITVAGLHLGLDPAERADHVERVVTAAGDAGGRLLVAGDLNELPGGPSWTALAPLATDPRPAAGPTYPARAPRSRIDAVLAGPGLAVLDYDCWQADPADVALASDHRPVLAVVAPSA